MKQATDEAIYNSENVSAPVLAGERSRDILLRFTQDTMDGVYTNEAGLLEAAITDAIIAAINVAVTLI